MIGASPLESGDMFHATGIGCQTLIGVGREERPSDRGNCFGVFVEKVTRDDILKGDFKEYKIVNFNVENLNALIKLGLTWPVQCKLLAGRTAIIHDPRIGERWYSGSYCEVCCPKALLPIHQIQRHERDIMSGNRTEGDGFITMNFKERQFP